MGPATGPWDAERWSYRFVAVGVVVVGLALLTHELGVVPAELAGPVAMGGPVALMLAGAALMRWGWPARPKAAPTFLVERGPAERAELLVETGSNDLTLSAFAGSSQLAVGEFPNLQGPQVETKGSVTCLKLESNRVVPYLAGAPWHLALARGLPWVIDLRASGGHLDLDLRDLAVAGLTVHSAYGRVDLTVPVQGTAELHLQLGLGDLAVTVPPGAEAKLRLEAGALVNVQVDERRFIQVAPHEWMTPLYPTTTHRCTVIAALSAGDVAIT